MILFLCCISLLRYPDYRFYYQTCEPLCILCRCFVMAFLSRMKLDTSHVRICTSFVLFWLCIRGATLNVILWTFNAAGSWSVVTGVTNGSTVTVWASASPAVASWRRTERITSVRLALLAKVPRTPWSSSLCYPERLWAPRPRACSPRRPEKKDRARTRALKGRSGSRALAAQKGESSSSHR